MTMKSLKKHFFAFALAALFFGATTVAHAQKISRKEKKAEIAAIVKGLVSSGNYIFQASYANSTGGSFPVYSTYNLKVVKDTVAAYLPYFGTSHISPNDPGALEVKFTWTKFNYNIKPRKKGNWEVKIDPQVSNIGANSDVRSLTLNISADGSASLQVINSNRDPISYDGFIVDRSQVN